MKKNQNKRSLYELIFTIVLPVLLLNNLSDRIETNGPLIALIVALCFPIGYFFYDFLKTKHVSVISILGFVNILLTGGFALFQLNSHWFAVKETSIPLLIGIAVAFTAFTKKPFINMILSNEDIINTELIKEKLHEHASVDRYAEHLKTLTLYFAFTFLVSAILNYILAISIVTEIPIDIIGEARMKIRNTQIADLTWKSYLVILAPSMAMLGFIMWKANGVIRECTELSLEDVLKK
jgi:intracellular septation protein A